MGTLNSKPLFRFWAVLGLVAMIGIWFLPWRFQTNDDVIMMWLVSGAYTGTPEPYAVFIHPSLSLLLSSLYEFSAKINWYGLSWYVILFLSYLGVVRVVSDQIKDINLSRTLNALALTTTLHFCLFPQFTLVAGWSAIAGFLLLFSTKENPKRNRLNFLAFLLLFSSLLVRLESFLLVGIAFGVYFLVVQKGRIILVQWKQFGLLLLMFFLVFGSEKLYENKSKHKNYLEFNALRSTVIDHPVFYDLSREKKIKEEKWLYFSRWMIDGLDINAEELIEKKVELDSILLSTEYFVKSLIRIKSIAQTELFKSTLSLILLILILFIRFPTQRLLGFLAFWAIFFLLVNFFFLLQGRVLILFCLILWFPLLEIGSQRGSKISFKWAPLILVVLFLIHLANTQLEAHGRQVLNKELNTLLSKEELEIPLFTEGFFEYNYLPNHSNGGKAPSLSYGWISRSRWQTTAFENNGFSTIQGLGEFQLLWFKSREAPIFPKYLEYTGGEIELIGAIKGEYFDLMHFRRK